ncbi:MAG TPA: helix-hairpin-helix domain-containing protein [Phycisphaerales bacterium]|nr:helix-hairpin-helix domain-containing protein [Phycisphaerales bacterium]
MVFGIIIVAAVIISMIQSSAFSQAAAGRESMARVRATWAARAGVEATLARLEYATENPEPGDAFKLMDDMVEIADGVLIDATYRIATTEGNKEVPGPLDAHAKLNINRMTRDQLLTIEPLMTEDIADSILDWIDTDEEPNPMGAESPYYMSLPYSYLARNGPMQSIMELELVAGVDQRDLRGEDWNGNGLLDPNENDGEASWPPDNADGILDMGWSGILTAASVDGGLGASGEPRLNLKTASESDIAQRTTVTGAQASVIANYAANNENATMADFIGRSLRSLGQQPGQPPPQVEALTDEQLGLLLDECDIPAEQAAGPIPGKLNINTCPAEVMRFIPEIGDEMADAIISDRSGRADGYTSIIDLLEVPGMNRRTLATLYNLLTVRSNVYVVTSRGRDTKTGLEVEMTVTLDRSAVPVVIKEVRVR